MAEAWTVARVKEELPAVQVQLPDGRVLTAEVDGRREPQAWVHVEIQAGVWLHYQYAWACLVRSLNSGRPLTT
jgi:hypothetical protein